MSETTREEGHPDATTVEWRLFADIAETAGTARASVRIEGEPSLAAALAALTDAHPELADQATATHGPGPAEHLTVLRNGQRVEDPDAAVADGDELALMPPVAGG